MIDHYLRVLLYTFREQDQTPLGSKSCKQLKKERKMLNKWSEVSLHPQDRGSSTEKLEF